MGTLFPVPDNFDWTDGMDLLFTSTETDLETLQAQVMPMEGNEEASDVSTYKKAVSKKPLLKAKSSTLRVYDTLSTAATIRKFNNKISAQKSRDEHKKKVKVLEETIAQHEKDIKAMKQEIASLDDRVNALTCH
jgi:septal ring factor EnvC (AmiA/AmiB activator)